MLKIGDYVRVKKEFNVYGTLVHKANEIGQIVAIEKGRFFRKRYVVNYNPRGDISSGKNYEFQGYWYRNEIKKISKKEAFIEAL